MAASIFGPALFVMHKIPRYFIITRLAVKMSQSTGTVTYPAVFLSSINFHVSAIIWVFQQAVVLKEQPGALSQTFTLVVMILLDEFLHQLEQTLGVFSVPLDQVLRKTPARSHEILNTIARWKCRSKVPQCQMFCHGNDFTGAKKSFVCIQTRLTGRSWILHSCDFWYPIGLFLGKV